MISNNSNKNIGVDTKTNTTNSYTNKINTKINNNNTITKTNNTKAKTNNSNKNNNKKKEKKVNHSMMMKSLSDFNLFKKDNLLHENENENLELGLDSEIEKQKEKLYKPIKNFLSEVKMPELFSIFLNKNIVTDNQIENLTDSDLVDMKITSKKRSKIIEKIKEIKMSNELIASEGVGGGDFGTQCDTRNVCDDPYTEDIDENERIQAELFKKAVEEFRNQGKPSTDKDKKDQPVDKSTKSATTNISENVVSNPKNFLLEIGGSDMLNLNKLRMFIDGGTDMKEDQEEDQDLISTQACWNCYKLTDVKKSVIYEERLFCSNKCVNEYKQKGEIKCSYCKRNFLKYKGVISGEKVFCSGTCFNNDRKVIKEDEENEDDEGDNNEDKNRNKNKYIKQEILDKYNNKNNDNNDVKFDDEIDILDI